MPQNMGTKPAGRHLLRLADSLANDVKKLRQENEALKERVRANDQMLREKLADLTETVRSLQSKFSWFYKLSVSLTRIAHGSAKEQVPRGYIRCDYFIVTHSIIDFNII